jgi:hypothetical protein
MAANVAVAQDPAGNLKPAKDKSTERIDGIVAVIMAIGRAMVAQEEPQPRILAVLRVNSFFRRLHRPRCPSPTLSPLRGCSSKKLGGRLVTSGLAGGRA